MLSKRRAGSAPPKSPTGIGSDPCRASQTAYCAYVAGSRRTINCSPWRSPLRTPDPSATARTAAVAHRCVTAAPGRRRRPYAHSRTAAPPPSSVIGSGRNQPSSSSGSPASSHPLSARAGTTETAASTLPIGVPTAPSAASPAAPFEGPPVGSRVRPRLFAGMQPRLSVAPGPRPPPAVPHPTRRRRPQTHSGSRRGGYGAGSVRRKAGRGASAGVGQRGRASRAGAAPALGAEPAAPGIRYARWHGRARTFRGGRAGTGGFSGSSGWGPCCGW